MSLWIKICGNTSLEDAQCAVDAGADAVGFVLAPSPRQVTAVQVAKIAPALPASIEKIGVFVDASFDAIAGAVEAGGLTGVQLHSDGPGNLALRLRRHFGNGLRILRVIHFGDQAPEQLNAAAEDSAIDGLLVDSRAAGAVGGTGVAYDWLLARATLFAHGRGLKLIAAGGLRPENVAQAIAVLNPWGVDVSSGVEAAPGRKDPARVHAFIAAARAAPAAASGKVASSA